MIEIDWARCATVPRAHQKDGVRALLQHPHFALMDQVGAGKSKQVIDAAQLLFEAGIIDTVVVTCPAFARGVWSNPDPALGEVAKHSWPSVPFDCREYSVLHPDLHKQRGVWGNYDRAALRLRWIVSNYEYLRREERLAPLLELIQHDRFLLVCDEAWALKDHSTAQWKAVNKIRQHCQRIVLLNGTPVADDPLDLYAQMRLLHPGILSTRYINKYGKEAWTGYVQFRARYAILKPNVSFPLVTGWQNLEELREKVSPYVLCRQTRDCFDLPPILDPILIEAKLTDATWAIYKQMRDDMVAWLDTGEASVAGQAIVRSLRLLQITSGFLGGILPEGDINAAAIREIGYEKLDAVIEWLQRLKPQPHRLLVWAVFRAEIERAQRVFEALSSREVHKLYGQQPTAERQAAIRALSPEVQPERPVIVFGNAEAGGAALNLAGASLAITLSRNPKLRVYLQARGRIDRPGQTEPIRYADVVATGPRQQRTIDHHILSALRSKESVAEWTTATWRRKLLEE